MEAQAAFLDIHVAPNTRKQRLMWDHFTGSLDKEDEKVKSSAAETYRTSLPLQPALCREEAEWAECEHRVAVVAHSQSFNRLRSQATAHAARLAPGNGRDVRNCGLTRDSECTPSSWSTPSARRAQSSGVAPSASMQSSARMKERLLVVVGVFKRAILLPANSGLHCGRSERPLRVQAGHQRGAPAGEDTEGHRLPQGADPAGGRLAGRRRRRGGRRGTDGIAGSGQAGCRAALAAALAALAQRIPGIADLARKEALAKQAREANVNIKVGNLTYAATGIESLRRALDALVTAANSELGG